MKTIITVILAMIMASAAEAQVKVDSIRLRPYYYGELTAPIVKDGQIVNAYEGYALIDVYISPKNYSDSASNYNGLKITTTVTITDEIDNTTKTIIRTAPLGGEPPPSSYLVCSIWIEEAECKKIAVTVESSKRYSNKSNFLRTMFLKSDYFDFFCRGLLE